MNIITLLQDFRRLIHENSDLSKWCQLKYGTGVQSFIGVDERNPPETGAPQVHLFPINKTTGAGVDNKTHQVGITCGIFDDSESVLVYQDARELQAVARLEEFRALVLAAIRTTAIDGLIFQEILTEYETVEYFPNFYAIMAITIDQPRAFAHERRGVPVTPGSQNDPYE